jgi:hypothetical protein
LKSLDNNVEAMTSGLLGLTFKGRPWSNNQQAPFNSHFQSQKIGKPTNYPRGDTFSRSFSYNGRKYPNPLSKKCFYYGKDNHILKKCRKRQIYEANWGVLLQQPQ